jgi:hypothetical protein
LANFSNMKNQVPAGLRRIFSGASRLTLPE